MKSDTCRILISIESRLDQVRFLRTAVQAIAAELGFDQPACSRIQLAVAEAVNNIIQHAYDNAANGRVDLTVSGETGILRLDLADDGKPLNRNETAKLLDREPDSDEANPPVRGRGLFILKQVMDSISFERVEGRNHLFLSKKC